MPIFGIQFRMRILIQSILIFFLINGFLVNQAEAQDTEPVVDYSFGIDGGDIPVRLQPFGAGEIIRMDSRICLQRLNQAFENLQKRDSLEGAPHRIEIYPQIFEGRITQLNIRVGDGNGSYSDRRTIDLLEGNLCNRIGPDYLSDQVESIASQWQASEGKVSPGSEQNLGDNEK
jgi:hypothetical protein